MAHTHPPHPGAEGLADEHERVRALLDALLAQVSGPGQNIDCIWECLRDLKRLDLPHHLWESDFFFPKVRQRCPALAPVLDRLLAEHAEMGRLYAQLVSELGAQVADPAEQREVIARLERFARFAIGHIEVEECYVAPVASDFLTAKDWIEIGRPAGLQKLKVCT